MIYTGHLKRCNDDDHSLKYSAEVLT